MIYDAAIIGTGPAGLFAAYQRHMEVIDISTVEQMVNSILSMGKHYALMAGSEFYEAKTILLPALQDLVAKFVRNVLESQKYTLNKVAKSTRNRMIPGTFLVAAAGLEPATSGL